jgi:hypothetical protein
MELRVASQPSRTHLARPGRVGEFRGRFSGRTPLVKGCNRVFQLRPTEPGSSPSGIRSETFSAALLGRFSAGQMATPRARLITCKIHRFTG